MSESKVSASREFHSRRANKVSGSESGTPLRRDVVSSSGDTRTFEFEGCSANFGVVLENKDHRSPNRTRSTLGNIKIAEILPDCLAKRDGRLAVGDQVLEINGHDLSRASLERARWYLGSALRSGKLKIQVLRDSSESKNMPLTNGIASPMEKDSAKPLQKNTVKKIHVLKDAHGLGVQISMKLNHATGEKGVFVSDISPGGTVARDGRLKEGDELLWINGHSLIGITQQEAVDLLRASPKLIQLVISSQGDASHAERKPVPRGRSDSYDVLHSNDVTYKKDQLVRMKRMAASADNLYDKRNKNLLERTKVKTNTLGRELERETYKSFSPQVDDLQQLANGPSRIVDHSSDKDDMDKHRDMRKMPRERQSNLPLNGGTTDLVNGRNRSLSISSESSNEVSSLKSEDILLSKDDESLDSEPVTLEDKPLTKSSGKIKSSSPSLGPKVAKKQTPPSPLLITSKGQDSDSKSSLAPGQISPSLPRPQSPGGLGIAFPARYLGDTAPKVMTVGIPTPLKVIGCNERDSPQANRKGSNDAAVRQNGVKEMEEEIVTIVLVKGMSGKGLGFTIVGGKGSPHGDLAVYVKNILPGGAAEADGRMKRGDELLSVNGTSFEGFTHKEALDTFKNIRRGIVTLKVRRNSPGAPSLSAFTTPRSSPGSSRRNSKDVTEESTSSSNSSSPTMFRKLRQKRSKKGKIIEIVLYKEPGSSLGIGLGGSSLSSKLQGIFVQCIIEGSPAANDGRLRHGDQLLEINDQKLEGLSVEKVYSILDRVPPGKVYIKVLPSETSEKLPLQLNDALTKLQNERQILDKRMPGKLKGTGTASTLSAASESSESCENMTSFSSSCDPLIPPSIEPNKKKKPQAQPEPEDAVSTDERDASDYVEDIYTIMKQPKGGLGMGVTIDKSRGNTIVEGVSVKSVTEGGSAALARSQRGVGLKIGDQIIEVNGTHLKGMDQEDVIKIFRDLPSSTQVKIGRSKTARKEDSTQKTAKRKESLENTPAQEPVPLPKPPENRRRSSLRNKMQRVKQEVPEDKPTAAVKIGDISSSPNNKTSQMKEFVPKEIIQNGSEVTEKAIERIESSNEVQNGPESRLKKPTPGNAKKTEDLTSTKSVKIQDELGDNLIVPSGYRKMTVRVKNSTNATLGISLVPSYGKLKGYFQIRRLLSGMVCAQDGQLHIGDRLVSVNGVSLKGVTHSMALQLLKKPMELVTFVILREGLETQGKASSVSEFTNDSSIQTSTMPGVDSVHSESNGGSSIPKSVDYEAQAESKDDSSLQDSAKSEDSSIHTKTPQPSIMDKTEKIERVFTPSSSSESQENNKPSKVNKLGEFPTSGSEDETSPDKPPDLPFSPPPPPLLDIDDLLDGDLSIPSPSPSFSPLPPPLPSDGASASEDDLQVSPFPVVSPPPALSPRMKEFIEQDLVGPEANHRSNSHGSKQRDEILQVSSCSLNQASSPDGLHLQSWPNLHDLSTSSNDYLLSLEQGSLPEAPVVLTDSFVLSSTLPSQTKVGETSDSDKRTKPSVPQVLPSRSKTNTPSPARVANSLTSKQSRNEPSQHDDKALGRRTLNDDLPGSISLLQSEGSNEKEKDVVKPVEGRRVENMPFVITFQKKFRSLGIKVDQSWDGRVSVTEVSSFGLVGKDGNIRVGDDVLSISGTPLDGVPIEVVQDMIKNCPRGNVRVVAQAGPKPPEQSNDDESIEIQRSNLSEHSSLEAANVGQPAELSLSVSKAGGDYELDGAFLKPRVDLPVELLSQDNSHGATDVVSSKAIQGVIPAKPPRQPRPDEMIATEECEPVAENSDLEDAVFDALPPPISPPPVPANEEQLEKAAAPVGELVVQDNAQEVAFEPPSIFDDFLGNSQTDPAPVVLNSAVDDAKVSLEAPSLAVLDSHSDVELKNESFIVAGAPLSFQRESTTSIKPPSLFGDDTESLSSLSPAKPPMDSFDDDAASWTGIKSVPIKPPSLFDDDLESLPSLPLPPSPPKLDRQLISNRGLDVSSSSSSSPLQSPWFKQKPFNETARARQSNAKVTSESKPRTSSPPSGTISALEVMDPFGDVPFEPSDVQDDDMSSLPPAPPPPQSSVNRSPSWSFRSSNKKTSVTPEHQGVPYISGPLPPPAEPERKNSKKKILPLRIRSKKDRKASQQSNASPESHHRHESLPHSGQTNFDYQPQQVVHIEPPEDDMESLPPAPPPPRMSPLTVESLENFVDGYQPMKAAQLIPHVSEQKTAIVSTKEETQSPKKKKKSFRRNVIHMDVTETLPEPLSQSTPIPPPSETPVITPVQRLAPQEDEIAVTDSPDAMSPPPLPPEMELWSESVSAEAELALLDQILSLEDSSKSGNEQYSEGGSTPASKRVAIHQDALDEAAADAHNFSSDQRELFEGYLESNNIPSPQTSPYAEEQTDLSSVVSHPKTNTTQIDEDPELPPIVADSNISTRDEIAQKEQLSEDSDLECYGEGSEIAHQGKDSRLPKQSSQDSDILQCSEDGNIVRQGLPGHLSKQPSEDSENGKVVKRRRPAPPIPVRNATDAKASSMTRKPLPAGLGIAVLPSKPDIRPKNVPPPHHPSPKHQKEDKISSPVKEKKKLFSRGHKSKQKPTDSNHLDSPDVSFDDNPGGRERSRSWTKRLFGFRSRSKSRDKTRERDDKTRRTDRSRSVSPSRGLISTSRRATPPPPPPSTEKGPTSKQRNSVEEREAYRKESDLYAVVVKSSKRPVHPATAQSSFESNSRPFERSSFVEGNNNEPDPGSEEDVISQEENNAMNAESHLYDEVSRKQDVCDWEDAGDESGHLVQDVNELTVSESRRIGLVTTTDVPKESVVYTSVDKARTDRPLPPLPTRREVTTVASSMDDEGQDDGGDKSPVTKPTVPNKPWFLKSNSSPNSQQQRTVDELKRKFNKASSCDERSETAVGHLERLTSDLRDNGVQDDLSDLGAFPSPGPPTFKPVPPPLALQENGNLSRTVDQGTAVCPSSPGPPRFKPTPPPLSMKTDAVPSGVSGDETTDVLDSPGPPKFKPEPPPLLMRNENNAFKQADRPSLPDQPSFKPLPPLPVTATMKQRQEEGPSVTPKQSGVEDLPQQHHNRQEMLNAQQRKMKPLPPIPTGFNLKTSDNTDTCVSVEHDDSRSSRKLLLSRQDAQQYDSIEDDRREEILENHPEIPEANDSSTLENHYSQVPEVAEPPMLQSEIVPANASQGDDIDSSDLSSEWDDTCSSTHDDHGWSVPVARFARSASFSVGDVQIKQPPAIEEQKRLPPGNIKRPPPPMRRRSSSLPHLFQESAASQEGSDSKDYWHTGNLQELINSRNQEPDVDEGVIEVQLLKEQQSIGLMVVGGLDTHLGMLYIKHIQPDSPAANCKRLRTGDQLLQVNDNCLVGVTHGEALNILKNTPPLVKLTVARKKDNEGNGLELEAERRRVSDFEEPIVNQARESSTISKTSEELSFTPPTERRPRPKSCISLSSFGTPLTSELSPSMFGSFGEPEEEYVPAYLEPESPTLNLRHDDVPVTIIDGIPGEDSDFTEEDEPRPRSKSVSWAVSDDTNKVFTVELLKNGRAGLGLSVSGGVDTPYDDIAVRQILSSSVTAQNGLIKKGDILLSVNGKSFKGLTNTEVLTVLKNTPDRVTLVLCRPLGLKKHERSHADRVVFSDSEAWPTKDETTKKKNLVNTKSNAPPALGKIPLDLAKQNSEHSTYDRLKKKLFSSSGSKSLKERLQKGPQGPSVSEVTLEKGASGLGFSLGGGQDSLYGDAPIHVRYVFKESVAGRSGKLKPGDEILEVNGQRVAYMTSVDALELIRRLPYGPVVMKIRRK